jgi:hypothetical protein
MFRTGIFAGRDGFVASMIMGPQGLERQRRSTGGGDRL